MFQSHKRLAGAVFAVAISCIHCTAHALRWDLNDVSIIYPLPEGDEDDRAMIRPSDGDKLGSLLPYELANAFTNIAPDSAERYSTLRLVAIRVDPCPRSEMPNCRPEIRLVWQSILAGSEGSGMFRTSSYLAYHTFYSLSLEEFKSFASSLSDCLARYSPSTEGKALNIHPAFLRDRVQGLFGSNLKKLLLSTIGESKLWRIAVNGRVALNAPAYALKELVDKKWVEKIIPGTADTVQSFKVIGTDPVAPAYELTPVPSGLQPETLSVILDGGKFFSTATAKEAIIAATELGSNQNPRMKRNSDNINCLACHIGPNRERMIRLAFPQFGLYNAPYRYKNESYDLSDSGPLGWGRFAMGFVSGILTTHTRTIAESAETADIMNLLYERKMSLAPQP